MPNLINLKIRVSKIHFGEKKWSGWSWIMSLKLLKENIEMEGVEGLYKKFGVLADAKDKAGEVRSGWDYNWNFELF